MLRRRTIPDFIFNFNLLQTSDESEEEEGERSDSGSDSDKDKVQAKQGKHMFVDWSVLLCTSLTWCASMQVLFRSLILCTT